MKIMDVDFQKSWYIESTVETQSSQHKRNML